MVDTKPADSEIRDICPRSVMALAAVGCVLLYLSGAFGHVIAVLCGIGAQYHDPGLAPRLMTHARGVYVRAANSWSAWDMRRSG